MNDKTLKNLTTRISWLEDEVKRLSGSSGVTHVGVVQDASSSMGDQIETTISGFNEYIETLKQEDDASQYRLTLTQFDTETRLVYDDLPLNKVEPLDRQTYRPNGMTALFDAISETIWMIESEMERGDTALIVVMTDGGENASREITDRRDIAKMIKKREKTDKWTFVFLGADQDAFTSGLSMGFAGGNSITYNKEATRGVYANLATATSGLRAVGGTTSTTFGTSHLKIVDPENTTWEPDEDDDSGS